MSPTNTTHSSGHDASHGDSHGSLRSYMVGTMLSLVLTLASFGVVMFHVVPPAAGIATIVVLCVAQLVVQLVYFLHIGASRSQRANTGIFVCTAFLIAVIVGLSLWVMHNANVNMMPTQISIERAMAHD
ncbi:cytochrome o ubiquinol oxidase subunit IV [Paraburkholderia sacchari]|uniref:cytochrome o ubiquinol oxidase subunit IV n=1 Tax=Paraburkholderia sacchari TaxID=159450 RepID=UPI0005443682|nr:cytochrome o ubiquinol oxidase subunit IV [Paraburkholderia sacchari]NLP60226.1 cytochrome o ubiquinol oxidase subunit IV [Paraburkholderia sacchari]